MLVKVLDAVSDILAKQNGTESISTEDTIANIEEKINQNDNIEDLVFFSTDVKSLYPSLDGRRCAAIIAKLVRESSLVVEDVNWEEAALYVALNLDRNKVEELGLGEVIPAWRRAGGRGRHPGIMTKEVRGPLQEEKDWERSLFLSPGRRATGEEKRLILSICVEQGLLAAVDGHLFVWHKEVMKKQTGLGIGSDLTRAVARLVMLDWDERFLNFAADNKITIYMYNRYVDDTANAA